MRPTTEEKTMGNVVDGMPTSPIEAAQAEVEVIAASKVHPLSQKLFHAAPCLAYVPILGPILEAYSPGLVMSIGLERVMVKGVIHSLMRLSIQPMLTGRYGLAAAMYQRLSTLYTLGWSVNSFFTAFADTFAVFGYTKRWYCVLCAVGGGVFALLYALLPAKESSAQPAAAFMFIMALFLANIDTFGAAIYSRRIRANPENGAAMVSWAWAMSHIGAIIGSAVQDPMSDHSLTQVGVYIAAGILFCLSFLFIFNVLGEQPNRVSRIEDAKADFLIRKRAEEASSSATAHASQPDYEKSGSLVHSAHSAENQHDDDDLAGFVEPEVKSVLWGAIEFNMEVVTRNWLMIIYCCIMTAAVVATAVVTILGSRWDVVYCACVVTVVVCGSAYLTLPLVVAKAGTFIFFFQVLYLNLPGVLNTYYVAKPACLKDGPHFSYTFYNITSSIVGDISSVIGIVIFSNCCQNYSYRGIMCAAGVLYPLISVFDFILVKRWNTHIGIPDHAIYIFGDALLADVVDYMLRMPMFLLISRVAPRGSESMVIALLDSMLHLGSTTSSAIGYILLETIWPITSKGAGKCNYKNAPWLIITGHMVAPLLIIPLAFVFLPSARVSATLDGRGNEVEEVVLPPTKCVPESELSNSSAASGVRTDTR